MKNVVLSDDIDVIPWDLIENELDEIGTQKQDVYDPQVIGYSGTSVFVKQLSSLTDDSVPVTMQVNWTAIDPQLYYRQSVDNFEPKIDILKVELLAPKSVIYLVDHPSEPQDPDYTLQGVFEAERKQWAEEAINDADDLLFTER